MFADTSKNATPDEERISAYLASPLGFSEATTMFMSKRYVPALRRAGIRTINPWDLTTSEEVAAVFSLPLGEARTEALRQLYELIGERNRQAIEECDIVIAELDGQEVDSGTASEVGYAVGLGKTAFGLRSDFRKNGEEGAIVNLQVQYFIESSGGCIASSLAQLASLLKQYVRIERRHANESRALLSHHRSSAAA